MPLLKDQNIISDRWHSLDDEAALGDHLGDHAQIIISWERWQKDRPTLSQSNATLGVAFPNTEDPKLLQDDLARLKLIALTFPVFRDGRAFSQARILREEMGFNGELRATGDILQDQVFFMLRCGFDAFALPDSADCVAWQQAMKDFSLWYQPTHGGKTIWQMRAENKG